MQFINLPSKKGRVVKDQNIQLYKIFMEVARLENITHASKSLFISQPAVTNAIHNLESNLNTVLFNRKRRGVELTEEGKILYHYLIVAFDTIARGEEAIENLAQSKKNI